jgi:quinoprotein dehydrogenase-associated probable ABC transporter substrate-binding protein
MMTTLRIADFVRQSSVGALRRLACVLAVAAVAPTLAMAQTEVKVERQAFRVCQDPNNLPFSNVSGEGIENRIAELFGKELGLPVTYYSFPQRLAFIRNTLRYKLPGEDFRCDIVMGVPAGYDQVSATKPYYHSTYALVYAKGRALDGVKTIDDLLALNPAARSKLRIGLYDRTPASDWLVKHGMVEQGVPYQTMNAEPEFYPGEILERDLVAGKIDAAIVWGPIAGYFTKRVKTAQLVSIPMRSEPGVKFDFKMAMGVRYGEREWKQQIETLIDSKQNEIRAILDEFGVPLVDDATLTLKN